MRFRAITRTHPMDIFISSNQLLKFYQIAQRVGVIKTQRVKQIIISSNLQSVGTTLPESKCEIMVQAQKQALELYGISDQICNCDEYLTGPKVMQFFESVLVDMPKSTLLDAAKQLKPITVEEKEKQGDMQVEEPEKSVKKKNNQLKIIEHAGMSFFPNFILGLSKCYQHKEIYTDYAIESPELTIKHHFEVRPLKQNPKSIIEEAASYLLASDTLNEVKKKLNKGFCEDGNVNYNPILDHCKVAFCFLDELEINGVSYKNVAEIQKEFKNQQITPQQLKQSVIQAFEKFWVESKELKEFQLLLNAKT